jgi:hypothetical protein
MADIHHSHDWEHRVHRISISRPPTQTEAVPASSRPDKTVRMLTICAGLAMCVLVALIVRFMW